MVTDNHGLFVADYEVDSTVVSGVVTSTGSGPLATVSRVLRIDVQITGSNTTIATHYWGYQWDNWDGRWLASDTPQATAGWISGGPHWPQVGGEFTGGTGLSGPLPSNAYKH
jgi:hypothetical protein